MRSSPHGFPGETGSDGLRSIAHAAARARPGIIGSVVAGKGKGTS